MQKGGAKPLNREEILKAVSIAKDENSRASNTSSIDAFITM